MAVKEHATDNIKDLNVHASIYFCARDEKYKTEKPYTLRYDPNGLFPATNITSEQHRVEIQNMRTRKPHYDVGGFTFQEFGSRMEYDDYEDESIIQDVHFPEIEACLEKTLNATFVQVVDFALRRRHPLYPIATGNPFKHMQPTSRAHLDVTETSAREDIRRALGARADEILQSRWQYVNVWHPLRGPLQDWPLAICDASSVDFPNDTMAGDVVDQDEVNENMQVQYNERQKWYYLPNQLPTELLIFKNADSRSAKEAVPFGTPHAAFDNPLSAVEGPLRESIEMRAIVAW